MHELHHTSAPSGLKTGTSGYTVVGRTQGIGRTLSDIAESLSSYEFLNKTNPRAFASEPINWIHLTGQGVHVVSRIAACAPDHTQRSNYLAHHLLLDPSELAKCPAGPAELLATPNLLMTEWTGEPREFSPRQLPALADVRPSTAGVVATGLDPGWSESLANRLRDPSVAETWLVYPRGMDMLALLRSVLSQLRPEERWAATFTTCASRNFPGRAFPARIKCVVAESDYAKEVLAKQNAFDLGANPAPPAQRRIIAPAKPTPAAPPAPAKTPGRPATPGPASISTRRVESDPFEDWKTMTAGPVAIAAPPSIEGPKWHHPWFLLPSLYSVGMTALCLWAVYLWGQAKQELDSTSRKLEATTKDLADKDEAFEQLDNRTKSQINQIKQLQDKIKSLQTPASRVAETAASEGHAEPKETTADKSAGLPSPPLEPAKSEPAVKKSAKPRLVYTQPLDELLDKSKVGKDQTLVEDLASALEDDALLLKGPAADVPGSKLSKKGDDWELNIGSRTVFKFKIEGEKLIVKALGDESPPFHRYFTLSIQAPGSKQWNLPLGSPLDFKLNLKSVGKGSDSRWWLFGGDDKQTAKQAEEFSLAIPTKGQPLYNVLEFPANLGLTSFHAFDPQRNNSQGLIGLGDTLTDAGIAISMPNDENKKYDCEIVALIAKLSRRNDTWVTPKQLDSDIAQQEIISNSRAPSGAKEDVVKQYAERARVARARVAELKTSLEASLNVLRKFKDVPVRWKLCPLKVPGDPSQGVDESKGLVIIDSLSDPKSER